MVINMNYVTGNENALYVTVYSNLKSDRVEVVAPEAVRNDVIEKIRNLNVKYRLEA